MSLKENVSFIKDEISTEEQFFENFFKIEKFYKKYKKVIFVSIGVLLLGFIGFAVSNIMSEQNLTSSNDAYRKVLLNNQDKAALEELKSANAELYKIALFQTSQSSVDSSDIVYVGDLVAYNNAVAKNDLIALDGMIMKQDFLLKDFAIVSKALILIEKQDYKKAKVTIAKIDEKSRVVPLSNMIKHFLLTK